jgi:glutamate formiminotransferase/formiminotetrahydrofolate cyclodeaminase
MVDEDTNAFNKIMEAFGLPKKSDDEITARNKAIQDATKYAIEVPFKVMQLCYDSMEVAQAMAETGNPNSVSDAGVGAIAALAGVKGAYLNVKINASDLDDKKFVEDIIAKGKKLQEAAAKKQKEILNIVDEKL